MPRDPTFDPLAFSAAEDPTAFARAFLLALTKRAERDVPLRRWTPEHALGAYHWALNGAPALSDTSFLRLAYDAGLVFPAPRGRAPASAAAALYEDFVRDEVTAAAAGDLKSFQKDVALVLAGFGRRLAEHEERATARESALAEAEVGAAKLRNQVASLEWKVGRPIEALPDFSALFSRVATLERAFLQHTHSAAFVAPLPSSVTPPTETSADAGATS